MVLALGLGLADCGGDDEEPDPEPMRCGGVHWVEAESRDGYTGCQGNAGDWTCERGTAPSELTGDSCLAVLNTHCE